MAFSPSTGELILKAAQGLSQTLQLQQQLVQRQQAQEQNFQLRLESSRAAQEQAKTRADQAEQRLELQRQQVELSQQRLVFDAAKASEDLDLRRQALKLREAGAGQMALNITNDFRQQRGAQLFLSPQAGEDLKGILGNEFSTQEIQQLQNNFAQNITRGGVVSRLSAAQERLAEFQQQSSLLPPTLRTPDSAAQEANLQKEVKAAEGMVKWFNQNQQQIEQITPQTAPPDVLEAASVTRDLLEIEETAFTGTDVGITERTLILGDLQKGDTSAAVTRLGPMILGSDGKVDRAKWVNFNNWIVSQLGAEASKQARQQLINEIVNQNATPRP